MTDISPVHALTGLKSLSCGPGNAGKGKLSDLSPLQGMKLNWLACSFNLVSDLSPLRGMPLTNLNCSESQVADLSPLRGMLLTNLNCSYSQVADLSPLQGMPLESLYFPFTQVSDLSSVEGMHLKYLACHNTKVSKLTPLEGMPLTYMSFSDTQVSDLSPLKGMNLTHVWITPQNITKGMDVIRQMKSVKVISNSRNQTWSPTEFWKKYDAGEFGKPAAPAKLAYLDPAFQQWVKETQALPAEKQIEAVSKKLMELNPGFDGKVAGWDGKSTPKIENGVVVDMAFLTDNVTDISPLRAFTGLKLLECIGSGPRKGRLSDLSPLHGTPLTHLVCRYTQVSDLSMLQGVPLEYLNCHGTQVSDLSPLRGMKLSVVICNQSQVSDLSPLHGMPLIRLDCPDTQVSDVSPVRGAPLIYFNCENTNVSDLKPLQGMKLTGVRFTPKSITSGLDVIQQMKGLKTIGTSNTGDFPVAEFWKKYDAGEFGKPATPTNLAYLDPAFQQWVKAIQALPAEKQIEAVSKKLMELNPGFDGKVAGYDGTGTPKIENGVVTQFWFVSDNLTDISPVRALVGLRALSCSGSSLGKSKLSDLSALHGMPLTYLYCFYTQVSDLSPLTGMKLGYLNCSVTPVSDLSALKGMPLTGLRCEWTPISDLSPLQGMQLQSLNCVGTKVSDLSALEGCKSLGTLIAKETKVTASAVAALQKALPNCKIEWDDPAMALAGQPNQPWNTPAFQQWVKATQALPAEQQIEAVSKKLMELNPGFDGKVTGADNKGTPKIENGAVTEVAFYTDNVTDISPVRALAALRSLGCPGTLVGKGSLSDLSPLEGLKLTYLNCVSTQVSDLSPLKGLRLTTLHCRYTQVSDLSPLQGVPLTFLACSGTLVSNLAPLQGMPLTFLQCSETKVSDLSPLKGRKLTYLNCAYTQVSNLSPLEDCNTLTSLSVIHTGVTPAAVAALQKALPNCKIGWDDPAKAAAQPNQPWNTPAFQAWVKDTQALPAEKQIEAVSNKLMEVNLGFDGKVTNYNGQGLPTTQNGVVTALGFATKNVSDVSPVRALPGLKSLSCSWSGPDKGKLSDLSPLAGMKLTYLACSYTQVSDLTPLKEMPLTTLWCGATQVSDLSPLHGMKLTGLFCGATPVADLTPLKGLPLTDLRFDHTHVTDLSPLEGMKLTRITLTPKNIIKGLDVIRQIRTITLIGTTSTEALSPDEFWKKYDAGEFDTPAMTTQPNQPWNTPAFQAWLKEVQAMPAEKQIEAVSKKLKELNPGFDGKMMGPAFSGGGIRGSKKAWSRKSAFSLRTSRTSLRCGPWRD